MQKSRSLTIKSDRINEHPADISKAGLKPKLLGHKDVKTTMIYTHVLNYGPKGVRSPIDEQKAVSYPPELFGQVLTSIRHLLFTTILRNIKEVNEIMRFLYPKYRRNRLTAQRAGGGYTDQSNYCYREK